MRILSECDNLCWFCDNCKFTLTTRDEVFKAEVTTLKKEIDCLNREKQLTSKILENLEYTNELQKSLIQSYEKDGVHSPQLKPALPIDKPGTASTYSEIAKRPSKSPLLTIRSNESASNSDVYKEVTESVNPAQMNYLDRRFDAPGVGVSWMRSGPPAVRSVRVLKSLVRNAYDPPNLHVYGEYVSDFQSLKLYLHHTDDLQLIIIEQKSKSFSKLNLNINKV
nr:unnamed protein product [Callosobruchus analis]